VRRGDVPAVVEVNVVLVQEIDPPADAEPVEWVLVTTEPIATREQILPASWMLTVVDG